MEYRDATLIKIGNAIRLERERNGFNQADLAEDAKVHPNYIGQIERAEKSPTILKVYNICTALGLSVGDFFTQIEL